MFENTFKQVSGLLVLTIILMVTGSHSVQAQTRCTTDSFSNTTCRSSDGTVLRGSTDSFGNETWRDNSGNSYRGHTDSFGNKTFRDNHGNTLRGNTDSFGNETWRDNQGIRFAEQLTLLATRPTETARATSHVAIRIPLVIRPVDDGIVANE